MMRHRNILGQPRRTWLPPNTRHDRVVDSHKCTAYLHLAQRGAITNGRGSVTQQSMLVSEHRPPRACHERPRLPQHFILDSSARPGGEQIKRVEHMRPAPEALIYLRDGLVIWSGNANDSRTLVKMMRCTVFLVDMLSGWDRPGARVPTSIIQIPYRSSPQKWKK